MDASLARRLCFLYCWFVCLFVCYQHYSKVMNGLRWNFVEDSAVLKKNKWLDFCSDSDHHTDCPIRHPASTQQIMSRFWWNFQDGPVMIRGITDWIFGVIWIIMLTLQIGNPAIWGNELIWPRRSECSYLTGFYCMVDICTTHM